MSKDTRGKIAPDDSTLWKCNWLNCVHGCGLSGSGICSRDGEWDNPKCKQFCKIPKHMKAHQPPNCVIVTCRKCKGLVAMARVGDIAIVNIRHTDDGSDFSRVQDLKFERRELVAISRMLICECKS